MKGFASERVSVSRTQRADREPADALDGQRASVVVALDGRAHDADAIALVRTLRNAFDGEIVLVHVVPELPLGRGMGEFHSVELREGQELLARAAANIAEPVEVELINPWPASLALERVAVRRHATLIVLGSSHRNQLSRIVPGAVALRLLKSAPCPVAVAPVGYAEDPVGSITDVGVGYDASSGSDRALQAAASASARMKVPLHVYHAVPYDELDEPARAQMMNVSKVILDRAREQLPPWMNARARELVGDPAAAIVSAVNDDNIGVLFAGSRGYGPLREGLFGGVCRALLRSAPCPIVLIPHATANHWR